MRKTYIAYFMTASAIILAICGIGLIFASEEVGNRLFGVTTNYLPISLCGGAMFSFGAMNWVARRSVLGGIYGRAVVAGNQAHFFIGSMILLRAAFNADFPWPTVVLLCLYALHALMFSYLMFWSSGLD
jgi:hypothetical protein